MIKSLFVLTGLVLVGALCAYIYADFQCNSVGILEPLCKTFNNNYKNYMVLSKNLFILGVTLFLGTVALAFIKGLYNSIKEMRDEDKE